MTILEEIIHSVQNNLQRLNKEAVIQVNEINEELAKTILELDDNTVSQLSEYLQLQLVPEEFVIAKRANLFFMLNPDNFITNVLGPDIMTYNKVDIDPKILEFIPIITRDLSKMVKANSRSTCGVYNYGGHGRVCSSKYTKRLIQIFKIIYLHSLVLIILRTV